MGRFTRGKDGRLYHGKGTEGGRAADPADNFPIGREEPELPYLPDNDDELDAPVKATPKEEAVTLAAVSAVSGIMAGIALFSYIPTGGSLIIAGGALVVSVAVTALALYKVVAYFLKHR